MYLLSEYDEIGFLTLRPAGKKAGGALSYVFRAGVEEAAEWPLGQLQLANTKAEQIDPAFFSPRTNPAQLREVAENFASSALPPQIRARLVDWASANPELESTLVIDVARPDWHGWVADLPWELLPAALDLDLLVVRRPGKKLPGGGKKPGLEEARLLVAGWPRLPTGARLEGVMREVGQLPARFRGEALAVDAMLSPTIEDFARKVQDYKPNILHLAVANGFRIVDPVSEAIHLTLDPLDNGGPDAPAGPTAGPGEGPVAKLAREPVLATLPAGDLIDTLAGIREIRACILNTMPNPVVASFSLYRELCTRLGVAVVGWSGGVQDTVAVDFALYWYQRVLEGATLAQAMRSFAYQYGRRQWVLGAMPTLWIPSEAWLETPLLDVEAPEAEEAPSPPPRIVAPEKAAPETPAGEPVVVPLQKSLASRPVPGEWARLLGPVTREIEIGFSPQPSLFPSLLINRQPAIRELTLDTPDDVACRLEIVCDAGGRTSAFREIRQLRKGHNVIDVSSMEFPALYELIDSDERRIVTFEVTVFVDDRRVGQKTRSVPWRARREWLDSEEAWPYVPAFVLPMSRAVGEIVGEAEHVLTQIGKPRDSFNGYSKNEADRVEQARSQMKAIYHAVRDRGLKYITPPGSPVYVVDPAVVETERDPQREDSPEAAAGGDEGLPALARVSGQLVRLPDDVLQRGHGTCHDLTLLLAAATEYVSLRPLVILLPGHTFFGLWLDDGAQADFWKTHPGGGREVGDTWTIPQHALENLVKNEGKVLLLESNLVTNAYATFERAVQEGERLLQRRFDAVIDIRASRREVHSLPVP